MDCRGVAVAMLMASGCATSMTHRTEAVSPGSRVGVLITDAGGAEVEPTFGDSYVYNALIQEGLVPVAMNDVDVSQVVPRLFERLELRSEQGVPRPTDWFLSTLVPYFVEKKLDYVMVVHTWTLGFDYDIKAVMIDAKRLDVVTSVDRRFRVMGALWGGLSLVFGVSLLVCPWMYLRDVDEHNYELVRHFARYAVGKRG